MRTWYDKDARTRVFVAGEEVLVLLPTSSSSLEAQWQGPYKVTSKISPVDYEVDTTWGRQTKMAHSLTTIGRHLECAIQTKLVVELELALIRRKHSCRFWNKSIICQKDTKGFS